jgi:4-amino-4-deoxy-L-arabinose transferase-like glycosyltransferase
MTETLLENRRTSWVLAALMLVLFSLTNLPWELDGYDQAKQAWTSYEMVTEGHWFYQRTSDDQGLATKPPLTGWTSAAIFAVARSWEIAWRLPSLVCAVLIACLLHRSASRAYGSIAGLIAFAAFGFNLLSPRLATLVRSDMPLALVIFAIGLLVWEKIRTGASWSARDRWIMFGLLTAGMLIKGPIIYAFLLLGIAVYQFSFRKTENAKVWFGWWPWIGSLAIFLVWVIAGWVWVPRFFELVIEREFLARFGQVGTHVHRAQSFFFYIPHLLHKFFPWSALMLVLVVDRSLSPARDPRGLSRPLRSAPAGSVVDLRARKWSFRKAFSEMSPATLWLICWSVGGLLVMSLIPSKRVDRIFPIIPPLCLLLAAQTAFFLNEAKARGRNLRWIAATLVVAVLFTSAYAASRIVSGYRDHRDALSIFGRQVREEAAKNHWRYEAVGKTDEGLPLYLMRPHFLKLDVAVTEWNAGKIDALAVPANQAPQLITELRDATPRFESARRENLGRPNYILLTH